MDEGKAKPMKLSATQEAHLKALLDGQRSAYPRLNMGTLNALERRNLVSSVKGVGSFYSPKTAIRWSITKAGREALAACPK